MSKRPKRKQKAKPRPAKRKPSTALARRPITTVEVLPPPDPNARTFNEGLMVGTLGLSELKLKPKEEAALARPVDPGAVRIKPTGQPYLPHPVYTKWFNDAFGRLGWTLVPVGKPALQGNSVVVPYVLYVHGKPVAFAQGEQEYFEKNREQTYGDALESTIASALRRCAKRLGVGLDLWDPAFNHQWIAEHAVQVPVRLKDGSTKMHWRRRNDPKFWNERGADEARNAEPAQRAASPEWQQPASEPVAAHHQQSTAKISDLQRKRLWVIVRNSGRGEEQVREWLLGRFKLSSTKDVTRDIYEYVCTAIEAPGPLPAAR